MAIRARQVVILVGLLLTYTGPYLYVYGRTATWTFPRVDAQDAQAIERIDAFVDTNLTLLTIETRQAGSQTWSEAVYEIRIGVQRRIFNDWINFPTLLAVTDLRFAGTGVANGTILLECDHFETELFQPTGFEPWAQYQRLLAENNDTFVTASCTGEGAPTIDVSMLPLSITFDWTMSAVVRGDRNEQPREWAGTHSATVLAA